MMSGICAPPLAGGLTSATVYCAGTADRDRGNDGRDALERRDLESCGSLADDTARAVDDHLVRVYHKCGGANCKRRAAAHLDIAERNSIDYRLGDFKKAIECWR